MFGGAAFVLAGDNMFAGGRSFISGETRRGALETGNPLVDFTLNAGAPSAAFRSGVLRGAVVGSEVATTQGPQRLLPALAGLPDRVARTFSGGRYSARTLADDLVVYRAEGGKAGRFGRWFGATRPGSAAEAERLYNTVSYGNDLLEVSAYRIRAGTSVYEGRVAGGTGTQYYLSNPRAAGVELLNSKPLPQYGF